jgi:thiamine biosynthesis protein ThiS
LVEQNGQAVPRENFAATSVKDGDKIEIVRMVAGG